LRYGEDVGAALVEELDRGRADGTEAVGGAAEAEMQLDGITPRAEIGIDAAQLGLRLVAPAILVERLAGDVEADRTALRAVLRRAGASPERAAADLRLEPFVGEAVLHLDGERAAQRIEPEDRVVAD